MPSVLCNLCASVFKFLHPPLCNLKFGYSSKNQMSEKFRVMAVGITASGIRTLRYCRSLFASTFKFSTLRLALLRLRLQVHEKNPDSVHFILFTHPFNLKFSSWCPSFGFGTPQCERAGNCLLQVVLCNELMWYLFS